MEHKGVWQMCFLSSLFSVSVIDNNMEAMLKTTPDDGFTPIWELIGAGGITQGYSMPQAIYFLKRKNMLMG